MKKFIEEHHNFFLYGICIIIFVLSIYNIIINFKHAAFLNEKVTVMDSSNNYKKFKDNILLIENNVNLYPNSNLHPFFIKMINLLKDGGAFRLFPNDKLSYVDLYNLNNYFQEVIDNGWTPYVDTLEDNNVYYNEYVNILIGNANYIDKELLNNSNYAYNSSNVIRNNIDEEYNFILNNYWKLSSLILEISDKMGDKYA